MSGSYVGAFTIPNSVAGSIITVSGVGFKPAAVILWGGLDSNTTSGYWAANSGMTFGFAIGSGVQATVGHLLEDGTTSEPCVGWQRRDACHYLYAYWSAADGYSKLDSMTDDGFKIVIADAYAAARRVNFLALKDTICSGGVYIGSSNIDEATDYAITEVNMGFQPDGLIAVRGPISDGETYTNNNYTDCTIGFVTNPYENSYMTAWGTHHGGVYINSALTYAVSGELASKLNSYYVTRKHEDMITFNGWTASGFKYRYHEIIEYPVGGWMYYLAMKGPSLHTGSFYTITTTGNIVIDDVGFTPKSILFVSNNQYRSINTLISGFFSDARISIGATDGNYQVVFAESSEDWTVPTEIMYGRSIDAVYMFCADNIVKGKMSVASLDNNGFTCSMDIPDPHPSFVTYLAIGDAYASSSKNAYVCGSGYIATPYVDDYRDSWTTQSDGYNLSPVLADSDDTTYAWYDNALVGDYFEVRLERLFGTKSGLHVLSWRAKRKSGATSVTLKCELRQGSTVIASDTQIISDDIIHEYNKNLTASEVSNITDYSELRIRVTIIAATF